MIRRCIIVLALGLVAPPVLLAAIWLLDRAAGTSWALPAAALFGLPLLAFTFKEPQR